MDIPLLGSPTSAQAISRNLKRPFCVFRNLEGRIRRRVCGGGREGSGRYREWELVWRWGERLVKMPVDGDSIRQAQKVGSGGNHDGRGNKGMAEEKVCSPSDVSTEERN